MKNRIALSLAIVLLVGTLSGCVQTPTDESFLFDRCILRTLFSDHNMYSDAYLNYQENGLDFTHYHNLAGVAILTMYETRQVDADIAAILQSLMDSYNRHAGFPRPAYTSTFGTLEYGWQTAMDAPTVGVAAIMAYELTGDDMYRTFLDSLLPFLKKQRKKAVICCRWMASYGCWNMPSRI